MVAHYPHFNHQRFSAILPLKQPHIDLIKTQYLLPVVTEKRNMNITKQYEPCLGYRSGVIRLNLSGDLSCTSSHISLWI